MKFSLSFYIIVLSMVCSIVVLTNGEPLSRPKRQLFTSLGRNNQQTETGPGQFAFPWFGPMPSPAGFPAFPMFPSAERLRVQAQDYIAAVTKHIQDQTLQTMNLASSVPNCTSSETKTETIEVNGRKFNQTTTTCISTGPGSMAAAVSSSSVPVNGQK